ncbi:hypothetical protein CWR41_01900 [Cedecea lapagei]|nr:hypothetical protein CWR41_01900 [Cedecea lapagei]
MIVVDLNADLGEGCGSDAELLTLVSSANIACGFHAGDAQTMRESVRGALKNGVAIGASGANPPRTADPLCALYAGRGPRRAPCAAAIHRTTGMEVE